MVVGLVLATSGTGRTEASSSQTVRCLIVEWAVPSCSSAATRSWVESWISASLITAVRQLCASLAPALRSGVLSGLVVTSSPMARTSSLGVAVRREVMVVEG